MKKLFNRFLDSGMFLHLGKIFLFSLGQRCSTQIPILAVLKGSRAAIYLRNLKIVQSLNVNLQKLGLCELMRIPSRLFSTAAIVYSNFLFTNKI